MHLWASCRGGCKEGGRGARSRRLRGGHPGLGAAALSRPGCSDAARMHIQAATVPRRSRCATGRIIRFRYVLSQSASQPAGAAPGVSRTARTCPWPPGCGWGCRSPAGRAAKRQPQARLQEWVRRDSGALCQLSALPHASMRWPIRCCATNSALCGSCASQRAAVLRLAVIPAAACTMHHTPLAANHLCNHTTDRRCSLHLTLAESSLPFHTLVRPLYSYRRSLRGARGALGQRVSEV